MNWHKALEESPTPEAVVETVNQYLSELGPCDREQLPEGIRLTSVDDERDLQQRSKTLMDVYCGSRGWPGDPLKTQDLVVFFMWASRRIAQLGKGEPRRRSPLFSLDRASRQQAC